MDYNKNSVSSSEITSLTDVKECLNVEGRAIDDRSLFRQIMQQQDGVKEKPENNQGNKIIILIAVTILFGIMGLLAGRMYGADFIAKTGEIFRFL